MAGSQIQYRTQVNKATQDKKLIVCPENDKSDSIFHPPVRVKACLQ
jgi:hypothetical protein